MSRRLTRARLPAPTRDRGAEHRAERVAHGERPAVGGRVVEARAPDRDDPRARARAR